MLTPPARGHLRPPQSAAVSSFCYCRKPNTIKAVTANVMTDSDRPPPLVRVATSRLSLVPLPQSVMSNLARNRCLLIINLTLIGELEVPKALSIRQFQLNLKLTVQQGTVPLPKQV
ncbi:hypothetical protein J6590_042966 [Homalodisca vitripennis]|nr:hypothetical protein J6590_042966 [Homalodisca vitripennis]